MQLRLVGRAIAGTRHIAYLEESVRAIDVGLIEDDLTRIDQVFPKGAIALPPLPSPSLDG